MAVFVWCCTHFIHLPASVPDNVKSASFGQHLWNLQAARWRSSSNFTLPSDGGVEGNDNNENQKEGKIMSTIVETPVIERSRGSSPRLRDTKLTGVHARNSVTTLPESGLQIKVMVSEAGDNLARINEATGANAALPEAVSDRDSTTKVASADQEELLRQFGRCPNYHFAFLLSLYGDLKPEHVEENRRTQTTIVILAC